jgi:protein-tyrosine phosphatase
VRRWAISDLPPFIRHLLSVIPHVPSAMHTVLFLCTGNYYRSRFAEILFNDLAARRNLAWQAVSRGLDISCPTNIGPISPFALDALRARGIRPAGRLRMPVQLTGDDLREASLIVALSDTEHRPMLRQRFPALADRVEYWQIDDLEAAAPEVALAAMETQVASLIERLAGPG